MNSDQSRRRPGSFAVFPTDTRFRTGPMQRGLRFQGLILALWCLGLAGMPAWGQAAFRQPPGTVEAPPSTTLTRLSELKRLDWHEANRRHPVQIRAVVTYTERQWPSLFIHDGTGACYVYPPTNAPALRIGDEIELEGWTEAGFSTAVRANRLAVVGTAPLPAPIPTTLDELATGRFDCERVTVTTTVRWMLQVYRRLVLHFGDSSGRFELHIAEQDIPLPEHLLDARVELTGVTGVRVNSRGHLIGVRMALLSLDDIRVLELSPTDPWNRPTQEINSLLRYHPEISFGQRTRVGGVITLSTPSGRIYVQDETGGVAVRLPPSQDRIDANGRYLEEPRSASLAPGDEVEVLGYPMRGDSAAGMVDARIRGTGRRGTVPVIPLAATNVLVDPPDARRVRMRGVLVAEESLQLRTGPEQRLTVVEDGVGYTVLMETANPMTLKLGCELELTGVLNVEVDARLQPSTFRLLVAEPADIRVVSQPSRFTVRNILIVTLPLGTVLVGWGLWLLGQISRQRVAARELSETRDRLRAGNTELESRVHQRTAELKHANAELSTANSQLRHTEGELQRALANERHLGELKSRFVSMVSHEFRTPLGITMSAVELLRNYLDRLSHTKRLELLDDIFRSTLRMSGLMEQVLVLGRVEAGRLTCLYAPVDIASLLERLLDEARSASHQRCHVEFRTHGELRTAQGDESLLRHIFANLLSNAIKYSPPNATVHLTVTRENHFARFEVRDSGIGIPSDDQPNLFEAFHRGTNVGQTPGTGLGLLIVKRSVELHHGRLSFNSVEGQGTTFHILLPLFDPTRIQPNS